MAYGIEIRKKVIEYIKEGHTARQAEDVFKVSKSTIYNWLQRKELAPKLNYPKYIKINKEKLKEYIKNNPDAYLREIAQEFNVTVSAVSQAFLKLKITNKKNTTVQRNKRRAASKVSSNI